MEPPIIGKELTSMFTDTLQPFNWEKMIRGVTSSFTDLVNIGELMEEGLKNGKISHEAGSYGGPKKFMGRRKEGETNVVSN